MTVSVESGMERMTTEDAEELSFYHQRIEEIPELGEMPSLTNLNLRWNLLKRVENIAQLTSLTRLDLNDNQLTKIEGLETLVNLEYLDISYNRIEKIEGLETLVNLKTLYLVHNKISTIEGLSTLKKLELLELGDNRIRKIENLEELSGSLRYLFLGANQIHRLENLPLPNLKSLNVTANAIQKIEGLEQLTSLEDLSLAQNGIRKIENLECLAPKLKLLDLNDNLIPAISGIDERFEQIATFWLRKNKIDSFNEILKLQVLPKLRNVTFEMNVIFTRPDYKQRITQILPEVTTIDGFPTGWTAGDPWQEIPDGWL